jgi:hypothetical protein
LSNKRFMPLPPWIGLSFDALLNAAQPIYTVYSLFIGLVPGEFANHGSVQVGGSPDGCVTGSGLMHLDNPKWGGWTNASKLDAS